MTTFRVVEDPSKTALGFADPKPNRVVQLCIDDELLCGFGTPDVKSALLSSVSKQPLSSLRAAVVFERVGAAPEPSKQFAPSEPTKSTIPEPDGQFPINVSVLLTNATLPEVAPMAIVPVASGAGRLSVPPRPAAS